MWRLVAVAGLLLSVRELIRWRRQQRTNPVILGQAFVALAASLVLLVMWIAGVG